MSASGKAGPCPPSLCRISFHPPGLGLGAGTGRAGAIDWAASFIRRANRVSAQGGAAGRVPPHPRRSQRLMASSGPGRPPAPGPGSSDNDQPSKEDGSQVKGGKLVMFLLRAPGSSARREHFPRLYGWPFLASYLGWRFMVFFLREVWRRMALAEFPLPGRNPVAGSAAGLSRPPWAPLRISSGSSEEDRKEPAPRR